MTYDEAMLRYGSDRPTLRFGLEIADLGDGAARHASSRSSRACSSGGGVGARRSTPGARELSRAELDALDRVARRYGAKGLVWAFVEDDGGWRSPIAKFLSDGRARGVDAARSAPRPATCC